MNDYGLMRTESDSDKAPQDEQTDWLAGRARYFLPLKHYFLNFHFNHRLLATSWEAPSPGAWVGGVKPPHCQQWLASSSTAWHLCIVLLLLLFSFTPVRNYTEFACSTVSLLSILPILLSLWCHRPLCLCKHLTIFKHNVITPNFPTVLHIEVGSLTKLCLHFPIVITILSGK